MGPSRTRKLTALLVVTGLAGALVGVSGGAAGAAGPKPTGYADGTLTIGQLAPQTGALSNIVQSLTTPVSLAVDEINAAGGVLDKPVRYTQADDGTDPQVASQSLDRLLNS